MASMSLQRVGGDLSQVVLGRPRWPQTTGNAQIPLWERLVPCGLGVPGIFDKVAAQPVSTGGEECPLREIHKRDDFILISKKTWDTWDAWDKPHLERSFAVPCQKTVHGTNGVYLGQIPLPSVEEGACLIVNDGLPHAISPPVALSPAISLLGGLIANSLVSCCSFASSLILGRQHHTDPFSLRRAMNHSHSVWFQRRIPLCFPLSEAFWNGNGCESKPFTFRTPMQDETGSKGGVLRGVGGLFRLPTQLCGTSTHTRPENFYIFSMTRKTSP